MALRFPAIVIRFGIASLPFRKYLAYGLEKYGITNSRPSTLRFAGLILMN
jgi:hypothetical protein